MGWKKSSFTNHFPSEILKQILFNNFNIQSICKINIVVKVFNQNDKCSIFENIVTVKIVIIPGNWHKCITMYIVRTLHIIFLEI